MFHMSISNNSVWLISLWYFFTWSYKKGIKLLGKGYVIDEECTLQVSEIFIVLSEEIHIMPATYLIWDFIILQNANYLLKNVIIEFSQLSKSLTYLFELLFLNIIVVINLL